MKACTSPSDIKTRGDPVAAEHRDHDVVDVGEELHRRLDDPDRNCARKLASNRRRFCRPNSSIVARRRPKTCTSTCPVWVSSTRPFSDPVRFHCAANWTWLRRDEEGDPDGEGIDDHGHHREDR